MIRFTSPFIFIGLMTFTLFGLIYLTSLQAAAADTYDCLIINPESTSTMTCTTPDTASTTPLTSEQGSVMVFLLIIIAVFTIIDFIRRLFSKQLR